MLARTQVKLFAWVVLVDVVGFTTAHPNKVIGAVFDAPDSAGTCTKRTFRRGLVCSKVERTVLCNANLIPHTGCKELALCREVPACISRRQARPVEYLDLGAAGAGCGASVEIGVRAARDD